MAFWLRNKGKMQGNNYQVDKGPLLELPIYNPPEGNSQTLIDLMDQIIEAKKNNVPSEKLDSIETEINQAVFDLYNLTPEEIKIVEGND
jgi:adenine-specific DNA-methyltransferase